MDKLRTWKEIPRAGASRELCDLLRETMEPDLWFLQRELLELAENRKIKSVSAGRLSNAANQIGVERKRGPDPDGIKKTVAYWRISQNGKP